MSTAQEQKRQTEAAAAASGLRWCKRGAHEARSEGSYYRDSNGQRCWQCDTCTAQWRQIQQQRRTGGHSMPPAAPNRDPAAIERVLQDQAEAASQSREEPRGLGDIARTVAQIPRNSNTLNMGDAPYVAGRPKRKPQSTAAHRDCGVVEIDDCIPIPTSNLGRMGYPFGRLEVGQSFFAEKPKKGFTSVTRANNTHAPKVFTARFIEGTDPKRPGVTGYRVWRIK